MLVGGSIRTTLTQRINSDSLDFSVADCPTGCPNVKEIKKGAGCMQFVFVGAFGRSIINSLPPQSTSSSITYAWRGGLHTVPQTAVASLLDGLLKIIAEHQPYAGDVGGIFFWLMSSPNVLWNAH